MRARLAIAVLVALGSVAGIVALVNGGSANGDGATVASTTEWQPLASSPLQRTEIGAAHLGGSIYAVGGFTSTAPGRTTDEVARYDIAANSWTKLGPMPLGVNHPAVASFGGELYLHGGYTDGGAETDRLFRYSPSSDSWAELRPSGFPRAAHTLVPIGDKLYAAGGARGGSALRIMQLYDPGADRWRRAPAMRVAREHIGGVSVGPNLYVIAGRAGGRNLRVVERYQSVLRKWSEASPVRVARSGFQAAVVGGGRIVAAGGEQLAEGDSTIASVEILDPRARNGRGRWTRLPDLRTPRHGLGVVSEGNRVYTIEGGPQPGLAFSSALEFLDVPKPRRPRK